MIFFVENRGKLRLFQSSLTKPVHGDKALVHLGTAQMVKDEELRSLLRKRGYRILELYYDGYSDNKRNQLYNEIIDSL
jgi:hypothetical protein